MNNNKKHENFVRLANQRTNKVLDMIVLLGNLSNSSSYEYSEEEVNKIFNTINNELKNQKKRFNKKTNSKFSL